MKNAIAFFVFLAVISIEINGNNPPLRGEQIYTSSGEIVGYRVHPNKKYKADSFALLVQTTFGLGNIIRQVDGQVFGASGSGMVRYLYDRGVLTIEYGHGMYVEESSIYFVRRIDCKRMRIERKIFPLPGFGNNTGEGYLIECDSDRFQITNLNEVTIIDKGDCEFVVTLDHKEMFPITKHTKSNDREIDF